MTEQWATRGQRFQLRAVSSVAARIRAKIITRAPGQDGITVHDFPTQTLTGDLTLEASGTDLLPSVLPPAEIVGGWVHSDTAMRRGQCFVEIVHLDGAARVPVLSGYVYSEHGLGLVLEHSLDGPGYLHWVQEGNDVAGNVVTTVSLAASNLRRIVRAIIIKYEQTGGSTATITAAIRDMASSSVPTNFTIDSDTWISPDLVLAANEQGLMHVGEHGFLSTNDNATLAYADNSTAPNPFPLLVDQDDAVDLLVAAAAGASGDDYDVWVQYEDWIEV